MSILADEETYSRAAWFRFVFHQVRQSMSTTCDKCDRLIDDPLEIVATGEMRCSDCYYDVIGLR